MGIFYCFPHFIYLDIQFYKQGWSKGIDSGIEREMMCEVSHLTTCSDGGDLMGM